MMSEAPTTLTPDEEKFWMSYIDGEVRAVCEARGWRYQVRRKWSVREKPVADSSISDYEWKLCPGLRLHWPAWNALIRRGWRLLRSTTPGPDPSLRDVAPTDGSQPAGSDDSFEEGIYYVLSFDGPNRSFVLKHSTTFGDGLEEPEVETRTVIRWLEMVSAMKLSRRTRYPPSGWLRDHLFELVNRHGPSFFSIT